MSAKRQQEILPREPTVTEQYGRVEDGSGNLGHSATPRFPSPLIEPDVPISGIRLSDWFSSHGTQRCVEWSAFEAQEPAFPIDHITGEAFGPAPCHFVPSGEEIAHALIDVSVNTTECRSTRSVAEVV